ncbi:hypothetical protein Val02_69150 [Virgisporangium aliadipatigenens]|uniref:Uncharacterized protein n=1 Tax=Virgisporangium aliadipatigenens TaxID=741659 RepID=A0A8J3YQN0_9ACTN|nr:DUF5403 family protein [Virgisporangium aliadipatigenens]GIJ50029.1 hypothetical protein Val02_69150 [Virgisporangium aliadipatigenens]
MPTLNPRLTTIVARLPAVRRQVRTVAADVLTAARDRAQTQRRTGAFARSLRLARGRVDTRVESTDPAALAIEYGHTTPAGQPIPGEHILGGAAADIAARR